MDWNSKYVGYVIACYAIAFLCVAVVLLQTLWRAKVLKAQLREMKLSDTGQKEQA